MYIYVYICICVCLRYDRLCTHSNIIIKIILFQPIFNNFITDDYTAFRIRYKKSNHINMIT